MSVSAGRTIGRAAFTRVKSCGSTSASSCGAFCSKYCRTASTAFATTASSPTATAPTRAVPIVFAQVGEQVGAGFVQPLPRPGGNATGFMLYEYGIGAKWLELLKEIAPGVKQVAFLQNPAIRLGLASSARSRLRPHRSGWR